MKITVDDYERAVALFLNELKGADDIVSVMLYGSMARGTLRPGQSDIDSIVILRDEVFDERERFLKALSAMVEASERISQSGLPYQPHHYYGVGDLSCVHPQFVPTWRSDEMSKVILGQDVRSKVANTEAGRFVTRNIFFASQRIVLSLSLYLYKDPLTEQDCRSIIHDLILIKKVFPLAACWALDNWPDAPEAPQELKRLLPDIDTDVIERIDRLEREGGIECDAEDLRELVREALTLVEVLNYRIIAEVRPESENPRY